MSDILKLNYNNAIEVLAIELNKTFRRNFEAEGRPQKWLRSQKSKKYRDTKILTIRGNLSNLLLAVSVTDDVASVTVTPNPLATAYAYLMNYGGSYYRAPRNIRFRQNKSGRHVFAKLNHKKISKVVRSRGTIVNVPARPFLYIPDDELERMKEKFLKALTK